MKILTARQMRKIDRLTVERCGIPYPTLMETAGAQVAAAIEKYYGPIEGRRYTVFCGRGNNGGDGAVVARLLWMRGAAAVRTCLFGRIEETKGEARTNFEAVRKLFSKLSELGRPFTFVEISDPGWEEAEVDAKDLIVVDALFGTGLTRPVDGLFIKAIERVAALKKMGATVVSVDLPSGLSSDLAQPVGPHVCADLTVSLTAPKIGNILPPACQSNGRVVVASIGTPAWLIEEESESCLQLIEQGAVGQWLKQSIRAIDAHKSSVGDVLLIAGSRGKTGAAALSAETVLRAGAGLVTVATAKSAQALLVAQVNTEVMTEALAETPGGAIADAALDQVLQLAQKRTVIALGPGLSSNDESTRSFALRLVRMREAPMVIDADGLNALAPWPADLRGSDQLPIIMTPHPGEMARLTGRSSAEIVADRIETARELAVKHHLIIVLKGNRSLIAVPDGEVYVNPTGNPGMATAGSGDVLTGLIAGLLAQSPQTPTEATISGVYLHGLAGDLAADRVGMRSLIASEISSSLSEAILMVGGPAEKGTPSTITQI